MAFIENQKQEIIKKFQLHDKDTSSPQVQVAILTERLNYLRSHFNEHKKDHHSRTGLLKLVGQRKRLLRYLQKNDDNAYKGLIKELGIRK